MALQTRDILAPGTPVLATTIDGDNHRGRIVLTDTVSVVILTDIEKLYVFPWAGIREMVTTDDAAVIAAGREVNL